MTADTMTGDTGLRTMMAQRAILRDCERRSNRQSKAGFAKPAGNGRTIGCSRHACNSHLDTRKYSKCSCIKYRVLHAVPSIATTCRLQKRAESSTGSWSSHATNGKPQKKNLVPPHHDIKYHLICAPVSYLHKQVWNDFDCVRVP